MTTNEEFDFSIKTVPEEWTEAVPDALPTESERPTKQKAPKTMPSRRQADVFSAIMLTLAFSLVSGVAWYFAETNYSGSSIWWFPMLLGATLSLAGWVGGGGRSPTLRFSISTVFYVLTILVTGFLIAAVNIRALVNDRPTYGSLESQLIRDRFTNFDSIGGLIGGVVVIALITFGLSRRT